MPSINYFAIGAALGAAIGPRSKISQNPSAFREATAEMAEIVGRRRAHVQVLHRHESSDAHYLNLVGRAFFAVRDGFSPDRVVADPRFNRAYLAHCESFGLHDSAYNLNWTLLNLRKAGELRNLHSKRSVVPGQWRYSFASEISARILFYRCGVSVDRLICHPQLVREFDRLARQLAPGFSSFQYRWAALNLRKKGASVKRAQHIDREDVRWSESVRFRATQRVPQTKGIYSLLEDSAVLYVASSENLHLSVESQAHFTDISFGDSNLWHPDPRRLFWRFAEIKAPATARQELVNELIEEMVPVFNIPRRKAA
jgi:hypothetical protein